MECIAGCFGSKSPNRSRNHRKNLNTARNDVEPRPANNHRSDRPFSTTNQTGVSNKSRPFTTKRTCIDDSEKSDTPLLSRLSDLTDESDLSDPIGLYPNTSKQGTQYKILVSLWPLPECDGHWLSVVLWSIPVGWCVSNHQFLLAYNKLEMPGRLVVDYDFEKCHSR